MLEPNTNGSILTRHAQSEKLIMHLEVPLHTVNKLKLVRLYQRLFQTLRLIRQEGGTVQLSFVELGTFVPPNI